MSFTAITATTDWSSIAILRELVVAVDERARATGTAFDRYALWPEVVAGDSVTATASDIDNPAEFVASGDGTAGPYLCWPMLYVPIRPGTVEITAGAQVVTDDGEGVLMQTGDAVGVVDYATGEATVTFKSVVSGGTFVEATYTTDRTRLTLSEPWARTSWTGCTITVGGVPVEVVAVQSESEVDVPGDVEASGAAVLMSPAGMDVQDHAWWAALQDAVGDMRTSFLNSHIRPDGYEGEESMPHYTDNTWRTASGLQQNGYWRRLPLRAGTVTGTYDADTDTTALALSTGGALELFIGHDLLVQTVGIFEITAADEDEDTYTVAGNAECSGRRFAVLPLDTSDYDDDAFIYGDEGINYGQMAAGDLIGSWVLADLQAGLACLLWTKLVAEWLADDDPNWRNGQAYSNTSAAEAETAAQGWFDAGGTESDDYPFAAGARGVDVEYPPSSGTFYDYGAAYVRRSALAAWTWPATADGLTADVDCLNLAADVPGFAANGDWGGTYTAGTYHVWYTGEDATAGGESDPFGESGVGDYPSLPAAPASGWDDEGYSSLAAPAVVARWAFTY
jgi:hypothetical protein